MPYLQADHFITSIKYTKVTVLQPTYCVLVLCAQTAIGHYHLQYTSEHLLWALILQAMIPCKIMDWID